MARTSIKAAVRDAKTLDARVRKVADGAARPLVTTPTSDSFQNLNFKLGIGGDNPLTSARYGFNPITRDRTLLEWIHRGSWLGGIAVDTVADDMTRAGIDYVSEMRPEDQERLDHFMSTLNTWPSINEVIKWGRLYGGALGVVMIDGQDFRSPLRLETVGQGAYRGVLALDRWMVEPTLEDLVTEMGPHIGLPRYYRVQANSPALRGVSVHHSRVAFRYVGLELPYQQRLMENLWGISILERLYDRMVAFDSASTGAAQLVYKAYLRTLKIKGLRDIVASGNMAMTGLVSYVDTMRRFQSIEGLSMIDAEDELEVQGHSAFSGLSDALVQFGQQLSGALQIPLVRLFGQSPAGLSATGESDLRMYYDHINQLQEKNLLHGVNLIYKLGAKSSGIVVPPNFSLTFTSLWNLTDSDEASIAKTNSETINSAYEAGLIGRQTALKELRQASRVTGVFTNITQEMIASADDEPQAPGGEDMLSGLVGGGGGGNTEGDGNGTSGPQGQEGPVDAGAEGGKPVQQPTQGGGKAGGGSGAGSGAGRVLEKRPVTTPSTP